MPSISYACAKKTAKTEQKSCSKEKSEKSQEIDAEELERREQLKAKLWMNDLVRKFKVPNRADKE